MVFQTEGRSFKLGQRFVISNVMKAVDLYVARGGWRLLGDKHVQLEHLAYALTQLRKKVLDPLAEELEYILQGYLYHIQNKVLT